MAAVDRECEVVVVGAGFAGLSAARQLARDGIDVVVVEARDRVGGRSWTTTTERGFTVDRGGQWIGPTQRHLQSLADQLGVATFPTYTLGEGVQLGPGGTRDAYGGLVPTSDREAAAEAVEAILDLDLAAQEIPPEAPWTADGAAALDGGTLASWLDGHVEAAAARSLLRVAVKAVFGAEPAELSLLFTLFTLRAGGGLSNLARTTGGAQERRFAGGSQQLAQGMAAELGDRVVLGAPVVSIDHGPEHALVTTVWQAGDGSPANGANGANGVRDPDGGSRVWRVRGRRAIVAMPPVLSARLRWSPPLPGVRDQLAARMPMGAITKVHALYERPFWRDEGLNGQVVADGEVLCSTFDDSPADGSHGALVGFVAGDDCRRFEREGPGARRRAIVEELGRAFGPRAAEPVELVEQHWPAEPYSRGGPVAIVGPGALTTLGPALREPVGAVHWAGTETATEWCGYLDGALSSGLRAAGEVRTALNYPDRGPDGDPAGGTYRVGSERDGDGGMVGGGR